MYRGKKSGCQENGLVVEMRIGDSRKFCNLIWEKEVNLFGTAVSRLGYQKQEV